MKYDIDELLNKYIDGSVSNEELEYLTSLLNDDKEVIRKLKAHKLLERIFAEIPLEKSPAGITEKIMSGIVVTKSVAKKSFPFFNFVATLFLLGITGLILYSTFGLQFGSSQETITIMETIGIVKEEGATILKEVFGTNTRLILGSVVSFGVLISAFFMIDSHKIAKKKLGDMV